MTEEIVFRTLALEVRPSPETNDHQVRFIGDGEDLIARFWRGMIGLDPIDLLLDPCPLEATTTPHTATVARCDCGEVGCGSVEVEVCAVVEQVLWKEARRTLRFPGEPYAREIARARADTSWETPERTAARLVRLGLDPRALAAQGLSFEWASGRVRSGCFTVSLRLEPGPYQVLVELPWTDEGPERMAEATLALLGRPAGTWEAVRYLPQVPGLPPGPVRGPR